MNDYSQYAENDGTMTEMIGSAAEALMKIRTESDGATGAYVGIKEKTAHLIALLHGAMYPHVFCSGPASEKPTGITVSYQLQTAAEVLEGLLCSVLPGHDEKRAAEETEYFIGCLPNIKNILETDIQAAYDGDPAATSKTEIVLAYPSFTAISIYRMAHTLYERKIPLLPRIMTEYAHQTTAIDIHPGAAIGSYFFIDHGTGVVIGETTTIGDHVKLYQGVTLGAKSFDTDETGNPVKGIKRHPDIGSGVVIYAGATILGGNTKIGDGCVIGGNVWLTHSVESGKTVVASRAGASNEIR